MKMNTGAALTYSTRTGCVCDNLPNNNGISALATAILGEMDGTIMVVQPFFLEYASNILSGKVQFQL